MLLSPTGGEPIKNLNVKSPVSSLLAGILRLQLQPTLHATVRGATRDHLTEITRTTGIADPSAHPNNAIKNREITRPSKSSRGSAWRCQTPPHCGDFSNVTMCYYRRCRKLSSEEMELKRKEMMDQAKQREEDRENNVKRYKRQDEQEKQREKNAKYDRHAGFIQ